MFFLLRCGFWLAIVAMATPWALAPDDAKRVVAQARETFQMAAAMAPAVLPVSNSSSPCGSNLKTCIDAFAGITPAKDAAETENIDNDAYADTDRSTVDTTVTASTRRDVIAAALSEHGRSDNHRSVAAGPNSRHPSRTKTSGDPITRELLRFARRD